MSLLHILILHGNENEMMKEDGSKYRYLKVGEQVARTLSRAVGAKWTELWTSTSTGVARSKVVRVKPVKGGRVLPLSVSVLMAYL